MGPTSLNVESLIFWNFYAKFKQCVYVPIHNSCIWWFHNHPSLARKKVLYQLCCFSHCYLCQITLWFLLQWTEEAALDQVKLLVHIALLRWVTSCRSLGVQIGVFLSSPTRCMDWTWGLYHTNMCSATVLYPVHNCKHLSLQRNVRHLTLLLTFF